MTAKDTAAYARPLAERMRPENYDEVLGQDRIWAPGSSLRTLVEQDRFHALLFWGPPGSGKTSLAQVIGKASGRKVVPMSAVIHGVKDIRAEIQSSEGQLALGDKASLIFMDEIHRLSKSQQDVLLPALEKGTVRFIGATTENPSFEVNNAILSRTLVFRFERLSVTALVAILRRALAAPRAGIPPLEVTDGLLTAIAKAADGDARRALNLLDAAVVVAPKTGGPLTVELLASVAPELNLQYDRQGDQHYDTISAFIKSIRASQPDAAVYYMARMLAAGEDPMFVARRLVIAASEDVGNANPTALLVATSGLQAVHQVGVPEARIILSQVTTYLAASPKSNRAYLAVNKAMEDIEKTGSLPIPMHLRNAPTRLMKEMGYGEGYIYAHDDKKGAMRAQYLPDGLGSPTYYEPSEVGTEGQLKKNLERLRQDSTPAP
jgi:putative ATPase